MERYSQHHNATRGSKKTTAALIIVLAVIVLAVVLVITQTGTKEKTALIIENYDSISKGVVQYGDTATLNSNGYIVLDLMQGDYNAAYTLKQCNSPSLSYTTTFQSKSITYDPLKESVIVTADGNLQKQTLSASEQTSALTKEEVYVLEAQGTGNAKRKAILEPGSISFSSDGQTRLSFRAKCDDGSVTFKIYEAD